MAAVQDAYRFAWALEINQTPPMYAATTDLPEDAAVATLGHVYTKRIKRIDSQLHLELPEMFFGIGTDTNATFVLDNSDGAFDQSLEWRLKPVALYHYDRQLDVAVTDFTGIIVQTEFIGTEAHLTLGSQNSALFEELLPMALIDPNVSGPFAKAGSPGVPVPVVFGENVPVRPPSIFADVQSDPGGFDYAVGFDNLYINGLFLDSAPETPGFERMGEWIDAPGSPTFIDSTHFSVTGDMSARYFDTCPIRFRTTAGGATYLYTHVASYDAASTPDRVVLADALCGAGLSLVQLNGDWMVIRSYTNITTGLLIGPRTPPAPGPRITAVRTWAPEDSTFIALATNPLWPTATIHIADVIKEILTNTAWGLSATHPTTPETINSGTFAAANVVLGLANLTGAISGALGYDQQQRRAADVLGELLMLRGGRLGLDTVGAHTIIFDQQPAASAKNFTLGPGDADAIKIKRVTAHGRAPLDQAIRNVVLHWEPLGRTEFLSKFTAREYEMTATAPCLSIGQDKHYFNQWIASKPIAEKCVYYLAQKLKGADERLEFVTGVEARDVALGEAITVQVSSDGISGDWQVYAITKTLTEVTLACFRINNNAYGTPTGVVHSSDPTDVDQRTHPGAGSNLLVNPDFSPPAALAVGAVYPHGWYTYPLTGWGFGTSIPAWTMVPTMDYSAQVLPNTYGGHYLQTVFASVPLVPALSGTAPSGLYSAPIAVNRANVHDTVFASVYCDQADGVFLAIGEIPTFGSATAKFLQLVYDATDTNAQGWGRYYARGRLKTDTYQVVLLIGVNKSGTFNWDAADFRIMTRSGRRPPAWDRGKPIPVVMTAGAELTFAGTITVTASNLIPAGAYVRGVTARVTQAITLTAGTTGYDIGTSANPEAWASNVNRVALDQTTNSADFTVTNSTFYATATSVVVAGHTAAGPALGAITSGKIRVQVEYTFSTPASGN